MAEIRSRAELLRRHAERFRQMEARFRTSMEEVSKDLLGEAIDLTRGQPSGEGRMALLARADHPFARRHPGPLWPTPPIGSISGDLRRSLRAPVLYAGDTYTVTAKSVDVDYAKFVFSPDGTRLMWQRGAFQAAYDYSVARSAELARDLIDFQRSLL